MYNPWNLGGAKSFLFRDLGGLSPPSPYVEPPLRASGPFGPWLRRHCRQNESFCKLQNCQSTVSTLFSHNHVAALDQPRGSVGHTVTCRALVNTFKVYGSHLYWHVLVLVIFMFWF